MKKKKKERKKESHGAIPAHEEEINFSALGRNSSLVLGHLEATSVRQLTLLSWTQALCFKDGGSRQAVDVCWEICSMLDQP